MRRGGWSVVDPQRMHTTEKTAGRRRPRSPIRPTPKPSPQSRLPMPPPTPSIPPPTPERVTLTIGGIRRGAKATLPLCLSSLVYGIAFGLLAQGMGLSTAETVAMSALVFSGTAQVAVLQAGSGHPSLLVAFVTVVVANARYILMSAVLRPLLAPLGTLKATLALLPLVDSSFALATRARAKGDNDAGLFVGSALISYTGWVVGSGLGTVAGTIIPNPKAWGLDFIIVAFCAAAATMMVRGRGDLPPLFAAVLAVIACEWATPGPWTVVVAGLAGAIVGALRYRPPATGATP